MSSTDLGKADPHSWRPDTLTLDVEPSRPREENTFATDYYEILRVAPGADEETIERVYRTLADRFHPDNPSTGDQETFLRLQEAYETLSNRVERAKYNLMHQGTNGLSRFRLRGREFFDGVRGGQNRRLAVLCLLYRRRISTHEAPGLTSLDLEQLTGCTREELGAALWYLCEKRWAMLGEFTAYSITADGFDVVENKVQDRMEFRTLATWSYYSLPAPEDPAGREAARYKNDTLPFDIAPALTGQEDVFIADHYETLGIGPQADEETIERVYRTLADRFHPDNPGTGDEKAFRRIQEAYETLSDETRREQYNALRHRSRYSERFRLRGREFFDGIRGEQLRRLAVLCLLYRQTASEMPGLTVLDLEQLTGCTREELGSALWYLREKKWVKSGEFTEYSITAAGFDVVENKLDEREAARSRTWRDPEENRVNGFGYSQVNGSQPGEQHVLAAGQAEITVVSEAEPLPDEHVPSVAAQPLLLDAAAIEIIPAETNAAEQSPEQPGTARESAAIEGASVIADLVTLCEVLGEPVACDEPNAPATEQSPIANTAIVTGDQTSEISAIRTTNIEATELADESAQVAERPASIEEASSVAEQGAQIEPNAPVTDKPRLIDLPVIAESPTVGSFTKTPKPSDNNAEVVPMPIPIEEVPGIAEQSNSFENRGKQEEQEAPNSWAWLIPDDAYGTDNAWPHQASATQAVEPPPPMADAGNAAETNSDPITECAHTDTPSMSQAPGSSSTADSQIAEGSEQPAVTPEPMQSEAPAAPEDASPNAGAAQSQPGIQVTQSRGVSGMTNSMNGIAEQAVAATAEKRVIFSMGGKGGVGKTSVMTGLAEWFEENQIPVTLLDLDTENKAKGSFAHFFSGRVPKINIHTPAGLDAFVDILAEDAPAILADMGAGAGKITHDWFDKMYPDVTAAGVVFTAIGVVTSDPASVESVLNWAAALEHRVSYVVVENNLTEHTDFTYWRQSDEAEEFRQRLKPAIIRLDYRLADLENAARNYGVTLGRVARRTTGAPELQKASLVMRAQSARRRMFAEFDKVKELLLP